MCGIIFNSLDPVGLWGSQQNRINHYYHYIRILFPFISISILIGALRQKLGWWVGVCVGGWGYFSVYWLETVWEPLINLMEWI